MYSILLALLLNFICSDVHPTSDEINYGILRSLPHSQEIDSLVLTDLEFYLIKDQIHPNAFSNLSYVEMLPGAFVLSDKLDRFEWEAGVQHFFQNLPPLNKLTINNLHHGW